MALKAIAPPQGWRLTKKLLLIMHFTAIIFLSCCLTVSAAGFSQKVTLSAKDAKLEKVFREIKKQTGYGFLYTYEILGKAGPVTISVKDAELPAVLELLFNQQPLTWRILEKTVVVKEKEVKAETPDLSAVPPIDIKGRITHESGEAVAGVSVIVKGTNNGTTTNTNGEFTLVNVDAKAFLIISGTNVETVEIAVGNRTLLLLTIKTKVSPLDEVQIIAYGQTTNRLSTGNVSTVKAKDIAKQPVNNPLLALQGRVPGLTVTQNNGIPGGGINVQIQGQNSLLGSSTPLYVIDGIPVRSQMLPNVSGRGGILGSSGGSGSFDPAGGGNPLSYINLADIESIDVLKDADATSIYGSRAGNGAILITTKKGKAGDTRIDLNFQNGWGMVARRLNLLNTTQYLEMRREAFKNDGQSISSITDVPSDTNYDVNGLWDTTRNTDWQKELVGGIAHYIDAQFNISGGNKNTQFVVGAGFHRETTVFPGNLSDQKGSIHINLNHVSTDQRFHFLIDGKYLKDYNNLINNDLTQFAIKLPPNAPALFNSDGTLNWAPRPNGVSSWLNPLAYLENKYKIQVGNISSNATIGYKLLPELEIKSTFGYTSLQTNEVSISTTASKAPEQRQVYQSYLTSDFGNSSAVTWIVEPQINFKKSLLKGQVEALIGLTVQQSNNTAQQLSASGFSSEQVRENIQSATNILVVGNLITKYRYNALFGRVAYNREDKYIINFTARRDGSSRFGSENLFHNFGALGAAWIFSNENLIRNNVPALSFGKLRFSYGTTGNDGIGDYQFMNLYTPYSVPVPYQGSSGLYANGLPNPYLQWEKTKKLQSGLDLGFFKDRLLVNVGYFQNRSSNLLQFYALPATTGYPSVTQNFPATIENTGWEFSIRTDNIKTKSLTWTTNFNLTLPKNKLVAYRDLDQSTYANFLIIGESVNILKAFHFLGVDPQTGVYQFDSKGISTPTPDINEDRTVLINRDPKLFGGLQNSLSFGRFNLDFLFQYSLQRGSNYFYGSLPGYFSSRNSGAIDGNQPTYVLDRWQKEGDAGSIQKFSTSYSSPLYEAINNIGISDAGLMKVFYCRLKNISFSWNLSENWLRKLHMKNMRLYVQGQNLLTFTNFKGGDPESLSAYVLPPLKIVTVGVQVTL